MISFVCAPRSLDSFFGSGKVLQREIAEHAAHQKLSRQGGSSICCRLRNKGGFNVPPRVPPLGDDRRRAIELLGCCTQRKRMRSTTAAELKKLLGDVPPNRLMAQQWKGAIQRDERRETMKVDPNAFRHRKMLLERLKLPDEDRSLSRCFILLDCVRRRHHANEEVAPRVIEELTAALGSYPKSTKEVHHYIRTLAYLNRERRAKEKNPPRMPSTSSEDMQTASMLLGTYVVRGAAGSQTETMINLLGELPRNTNVAKWWKKAVDAARRKKKRRERSAEKRIEVEAKRRQRRLRRLEREGKKDAYIAYGNGQPPTRLDIRAGVLNRAEPISRAHPIGVSTHVVEANQNGKHSYLTRLYRFIGRFFRP